MKKKFLVIFIFFLSLLIYSNETEAATESQLIIINKKSNEMAFYNGSNLVRTFSVATGRNISLTPEGTFKIVNKIKNRPYYTDNIPGGDPRNPLGDRWLGLDAWGTYGTTYAIHGNNNPSSIGKYVSAGCVRMYNEEVRWLFDQVNLYTPVIITNSSSSFQAIAKANGYSVEKNGWELSNGKWYYYVNGVKKTGWLNDENKWYFLDGSGVMKTGWLSNGGKWYYFSSNGEMKTGWLAEGGSWYYLGPTGAMKTGWLKDGASWYYLAQNGAMKIGWVKDGSTWYYLDNKTGAMRTGWLLDKEWYYLDNTGAMKTGWFKYGNKWYYLQDYGGMKTGWVTLNGKSYFLLDTGIMATGWLWNDHKWYFLQNDGSKATNTVVNGYILGKDGVWIQVEYVALGDSLAAGQTPYKGYDKGYVDFITDKFDASYQVLDVDNFGVSGYTSVQLVEDVLHNEAVRKEISEATHITIDIGANDLLPLVQGDLSLIPAQLEKVSNNINTILSTIDQLNPNVNVYVMGYYNPFPYAPAEQQAALLQLLEALNGQIAYRANANGDYYIATADVIAANYVEYLPNPADIHLSVAGYGVLAEEFWREMGYKFN
ncbi:L,D-transpeptidase family protein [Fredinandcohnia sp. 179-A 10B2 NHS]|uniref:L,D-transpeptidase family protein n=1 Tax=Fredinandcohnia sp. 179-A 10B2 NHS TaxID=3235176 RepID=UPI00399F26C3